MSQLAAPIRSLAFATDLDVLAGQSRITDHGDHVTVVTEGNRGYHWGNYLLYREPPTAGDRDRWERSFELEVGERRHRLFAWDGTGGELGAARQEFLGAGYELEQVSALVATPRDLAPHPSANGDVTVRAIDPRPHGRDARAWRQVVELQMGNRDPVHEAGPYRSYLEAAARQRQELYGTGRAGGWYVAELEGGTVVATCGIVVTDGRARYQAVDTHYAHRRRGYAARLVHEVGREAIARHGAEQLVIVADVDYHAKALYETLGFAELHRSSAVAWHPGVPGAGAHPTLGHMARAGD